MKILCYLLTVFFIIGVLLVGCAKKEEAQKSLFIPADKLDYYVDKNKYPQPQAHDTTLSTTEEMVTCSYDGMTMKKSAMQASMEYKGKTLYFCTKAEMEKFKKDPESYLAPGKP